MFEVIEWYAGAGAAEEHANNSPTDAPVLNLLTRHTKAPSRASSTTVATNRATLRSWASESNRGEPGSARPLDPLTRPTDSATSACLSRWAPIAVAAPRQTGPEHEDPGHEGHEEHGEDGDLDVVRQMAEQMDPGGPPSRLL